MFLRCTLHTSARFQNDGVKISNSMYELFLNLDSSRSFSLLLNHGASSILAPNDIMGDALELDVYVSRIAKIFQV
jgi:hypothetical protein